MTRSHDVIVIGAGNAAMVAALTGDLRVGDGYQKFSYPLESIDGS